MISLKVTDNGNQGGSAISGVSEQKEITDVKMLRKLSSTRQKLTLL